MTDRIRTTEDIIGLVAACAPMVEALRAVEALNLPDCWIGAGFVRNTVWEALHDRPWPSSYTDIDVVYFDAGDRRAARDAEIETALGAALPNVPWSVKNQARMHAANGDPAYADTADALRHWPETCTAVALRSVGARIELLAPFGIMDLVSMIVRPTPAFEHKLDRYRARIAQKQWPQRWPRLRVMDGSGRN